MGDMFRSCQFFETGYNKASVEAFFTRAKRSYEEESTEVTSEIIRSTAFRLQRGGYDTHAVDRALDRLETSFALRERANAIASTGRARWIEHLSEQAKTLYPRLGRPRGERFDGAAKGHMAYDCDQVDDLLDKITAYFDEGSGVTVEELRQATFKRRIGKNGYAEGPVDAFIDRAIEVLLGVS